MAQRKVCLLTTNLLIVKFFLLPIIKKLSEEHDVTLVVNVADDAFLKKLNLNVRVVHLPIERKISIIKDIKSFFLFTRFLQKEKFSIIHTVAPKAGMIGILAGWLARVPVRLHLFQGEVWVTQSGWFRWLLKTVDRMVGWAATHLLVVSETERQFLINEGIISAQKSRVLGHGSIGGIDMERFKSNPTMRQKVRAELKMNENEIILLFVGRLNRDKGILDLVEAFGHLNSVDFSHVHLVIAGPDEENILVRLKAIPNSGRLHILPYTDAPENYMAAGDVLILPSYREGFGLVVMEAAACRVPSIGSRIYGISDAIVDHETGLLFEVGDSQDLANKMKILIQDENLRRQLGQAAYARCAEFFSQQKVLQALADFYRMI